MNRNASLRLSDKEFEELETLKKAYNISNTSELIRVLIRKDFKNLTTYEGLYLSDKQICKRGLYSLSNTNFKRKGVN